MGMEEREGRWVASGQPKGNVKQQPPLIIHQCCLLSLHLHLGQAKSHSPNAVH